MKPATVSLRAIASAPRAHLFTYSASAIRRLSTSVAVRSKGDPSSSSPFAFGGPAPPRLPKEDQEIFESLQRASTGAFSTPRTPPSINQSPDSTSSEVSDAQAAIRARLEKIQSEATPSSSEEPSKFKQQYDRVIEARGKGEELHPNLRRGAQPEFDGDVNPKTGEVGGPKNEPLRWGAAGEWSYNGRTTDF
ncbi:hypothetical protein EDD37DRAFT_631471 [Exophiala viscosa]|uniref:Succinate dehydrogenase assembly factor 4, mitochondrial n=1 Tax=Exophiala viscosa TaxID=2486360 RepID=A0AAN6IDM8_9EURO|nr:hypothetical protein EDD36DRAFT_420701 [Exophiala viscosa]KAI1623386.1 hypothetical protein EDD37DRAFT_631471 [Exophiala viscosa]